MTTGEVVTGTDERLATGDAVNVAARLEQAAAARRGARSAARPMRLIRDSVEVGDERQLELKGKAEPVSAYRLVRSGRRGLAPLRRADRRA